ncbi:hypothetical protein TCAP_03256 [Tolypocladium capitatum]|uniref:Uncharacterized protein n=1 Tax=Tolypocladium capitatum TaxID=45235 RepID=A0A2K3QGY3_9HYPO|nr:hypothetical protein TCAP_03256 [Tolypocladium capitatum]
MVIWPGIPREGLSVPGGKAKCRFYSRQADVPGRDPLVASVLPCPVAWSGLGGRKALRFCRGALTGYRLELPHVLHLMTRTSAHGLRHPLLGFSTTDWQVWPSIWRVSQNLQIVRFRAGPCRI